MFKSKLKRKKDISLKCNPPVDCFTCNKKDCTAPSGSKRTDLELKYLQNAGFDRYQNTTLRGDFVIRNFPNEMKSKRLDLHMSMSELSKRTNISKRILYQYENGEVEPSTIRFLKICHILGIDPKDFLK